MANKPAQLILDGKDTPIELPIYSPTLGRNVIDVKAISQNGVFTFDPGFVATASCESQITFINGIEGILLYRGYPIEQLAEHSDYLEVCYLVFYGKLPNKTEKENFVNYMKDNAQVDPRLAELFKGFSKDAHPMAMMTSALGALASYYYEGFDLLNPEHREQAALRLMAQIPTIAAMCYRHTQGKAFIAPKNDLTYAENFMHMMFGEDVDPVIAKAMDRIFTLHADHEQNASTSTVRMVGSTDAHPYACIAAGICALWGPAHGGANEACLNMLKEIGDVDNIEKYVLKAKDRNDPFKLMGFGHRVYKNFDPRATIMRDTCHEVLTAKGVDDSPLFKVAVELAKIAREDQYFIDRKLYPNVDYYSGITQSAIGIPANMFTVIFTLARTVGWLSQWNELLSAPYKIYRPRQLYTGETKRDFVSLDKR